MSYGSAITRKNEDVAQLIWSSLAEYDKRSSAEDMYSFQEQRSERETRHKNLLNTLLQRRTLMGHWEPNGKHTLLRADLILLSRAS